MPGPILPYMAEDSILLLGLPSDYSFLINAAASKMDLFLWEVFVLKYER